MDKNEFIDLLCGSNLPSEDKINELKEIIRQHPYSPLPHFILAKFYYHINHPEKELYLQLASAYATDRKILKQFIQKEYIPQEAGEENILFERHTYNQIEESPIDIEAEENIYASEHEVKEETEKDIYVSPTHDSDALTLSDNNDNNIGQQESDDNKIEDIESPEEVHLHPAAETNSEALGQEVNDNLEELRILKNQWLASEENKKEASEEPKEDINHYNGEIKETEETYLEEVSESYIESELFNEEPEMSQDLSVTEIHKAEEESISAPPLENGHDKIELSEEQILEKEATDEYEDKGEPSLLLDYLTKINSDKDEELESNYRSHQHELIEKFIKYTPSLPRASLNDKNLENQEDLSERSITSDSDLVSENLAVIMTKQGKIEKAIDIYKKLIWKYPQKKVYFASRIEELKNNNHMFIALIVVIIIASVFLVLVVIAQNSKGGGLANQFGGAGTSQLMGVKKTGDLLEKLTWGFAIAILVLSLSSNILIDSRSKTDDGGMDPELQKVIKEQPAAPNGAMPLKPSDSTATK